MMKYFLIIAFSIISLAQDTTATIGFNTITVDDFLEFVMKNHPLSTVADLQVDKAQSKLLKARGNFDPKLDLEYDSKDYDDKNYFSNGISSLKIPIWYGPNFKASYQRANGVFLNADQNVPEDGLFSFGVEIPLGNGLFYDSRRYEQNTAEIKNELSGFERQKFINDLVFRSRINFIEWYQSLTNQQILLQNQNNANQRLDLVKKGFFAGDIPAIDTLEAFVQYRNRFVDFNKGVAKFTNVLSKTAGFISFGEYFEELLVMQPVIEQTLDTNRLKEIIDNISGLNPDLQILNGKIEIAELNKDLALENLKPNVNVNYNFINNGENYYNFNEYQVANNKWNVNFSYPLFLRKQRGNIQLAEIDIKESELKLQEKSVSIFYKLEGLYNQIARIIPLIDEYQKVQENYAKLLEAEFVKYNLGDSSLFKVNTRENKLIEVQLKVIELITDLKKLEAEFYKEAGVVN